MSSGCGCQSRSPLPVVDAGEAPQLPLVLRFATLVLFLECAKNIVSEEHPRCWGRALAFTTLPWMHVKAAMRRNKTEAEATFLTQSFVSAAP